MAQDPKGRYSSGSQYVTASIACSSSFNCGMEYKTISVKVEELVTRVEYLENENKNIKEYYIEATKLLQIYRYILITIPIVGFIIVGIVSYWFNKNNGVAYGIMGIFGITIFANGFLLPKQIKELSERVKKIEQKEDVSNS